MPALPLLFGSVLVMCMAQASHGQGVVSGRVLDAVTGNQVVGAIVSLSWRTDSVSQRVGAKGQFFFTGLDAGEVLIRVRAIGFEPLEATLAIEGSDTVSLDVELDPVAQALDSIVVQAEGTLPPGLRGFEARRRAGGQGYYMDRNALAEYDDRQMASAVRTLTGLRLVPREGRGGYAVASARGGRTLSGAGGNATAGTCYAQIIVDGVRIWQPGGATTEPPPDVNQYATREIAGLEYYPGPATTPTEFSGEGATCGTLILWTRVR